MRFRIEQRFDRPARTVFDAYLEPSLYGRFSGLPRLGEVQGRSSTPDGDEVVVEAWYRFDADLPPGAGHLVERERLTWVEVTRYRAADLSGRFEIRPDHYRRLLRCSGAITLAGEGRACTRVVEADLRLSLPLLLRPLTGRAEAGVVDGLRRALEAQVPVVEAFIG